MTKFTRIHSCCNIYMHLGYFSKDKGKKMCFYNLQTDTL